MGSWDNFSKPYTMERDPRRARDQWRGCHSFKDIICDGDIPSQRRRDGGLKMGHTYYYYYELDGQQETHDPSLPSTTTCPYLPGQTVNTLWVPMEQKSRLRSGSTTSVCHSDFKTMNPGDKFKAPQAAVPRTDEMPPARVGSSPTAPTHKRSARSLSPSQHGFWSPRRLFCRKFSSSSHRSEPSLPLPSEGDGNAPQFSTGDREGSRSSGSSRSRDISPESLGRFLSDDAPLPVENPGSREAPSLFIPEDIIEEQEDDANFATSAVSETTPRTALSPPPFRRGLSSSSSLTTYTPADHPPRPATSAEFYYPQAPQRTPPMPPTRRSPVDADLFSHFSISDAESLAVSSPSLHSRASHDDIASFYHSDDDDEEYDEEMLPPPALEQSSRSRTSLLSGCYSLPRSSAGDDGSADRRKKMMLAVTANDAATMTAETAAPTPPALGHHGSPALVARSNDDDAGMTVANTSALLAVPIDSGLDDFVSELSWMADVIQVKKA